MFLGRLSLILICAKLLAVLRVQIVSLAVLFLTRCVIEIPYDAFGYIQLAVAVATLLVMRDEKILYKCDMNANTRSLLLTVYQLKKSVFANRLLQRVKKIRLQDALRFNLLAELLFLCFAVVVNLSFPSSLYSWSGRSQPEAKSIHDQINTVVNEVRAHELPKHFASKIDELLNNTEKILKGNKELISLVLSDYSSMKSEIEKLPDSENKKVINSLMESLGNIAAYLKRNDVLEYEIKLRNEQKKILDSTYAGLKGHIGGESTRIKILNREQQITMPLSVMYRVALRNYFNKREVPK